MAGRFACCLYHVVWSTKTRDRVIEEEWETELFSYIGGVMKNVGGSLKAAGGDADHIHLLISVPPSYSLSDIISRTKSNSSRWVRERFKLRRFQWQEGYSAFTVSKSLEPRVKQYLKGQRKRHKEKSFKSELIALLRLHHVDYDERFLLDGDDH